MSLPDRIVSENAGFDSSRRRCAGRSIDSSLAIVPAVDMATGLAMVLAVTWHCLRRCRQLNEGRPPPIRHAFAEAQMMSGTTLRFYDTVNRIASLPTVDPPIAVPSLPHFICTSVQMKWSCQQDLPRGQGADDGHRLAFRSAQHEPCGAGVGRKSIFFKGHSSTIPPMMARFRI